MSEYYNLAYCRYILVRKRKKEWKEIDKWQKK